MGDRPDSLKVGVLVSGRGSNLQAILEACSSKNFPARVAVVISNNPEAPALDRAKKFGVPSVVARNGAHQEEEILEGLRQYDVGLVCLAGFMKILSPKFVAAFKNKIMNIHPSLLPSFPGLGAQKKALESGAKRSGATVHFVDEGCDTGPIILQSEVTVHKDDTVESLSERILKEEHKIYPKAIELFATKRLKIVGRRVLKGEI